MGGCQCWLCSSAGGSRASHVQQRRLIRAPTSSEHVLLGLLGPHPSLTDTKILLARGRPDAVFRPPGSQELLWCVFLYQQMCALMRMVHEEMPQLSFRLRLLEICLQK